MSEPELSPTMTAQDRRAVWMIIAAPFLIIAVLFGLLSAVGRDLLFGWFFFLDRSLSTFQPDGLTLWVGIAAFAILFAVVHRMGQHWLKPSATNSAADQRRWTWRSTTAVCVGIGLLFAASVAMVASLHQLIWLAGNSQSSTQHAGRWSRAAGPLSVISQVRQATWRTQSKNQMKQLMMAMHNYHDVYSQFPPGAILHSDGVADRGWVAANASYQFWIQNADFFHRHWDHTDIQGTSKSAVPEFMHPELGWHGQFDDRGFALMHYAGNVHVFPNNRGLKLSEITDGTSHTLGIGEVAENFQPWASPWNRRDPADGINDVPWGFGGPPWQRGAQFGMVDGSVRFLSKNIDRQVLKALGAPAGGERIPADVLP